MSPLASFSDSQVGPSVQEETLPCFPPNTFPCGITGGIRMITSGEDGKMESVSDGWTDGAGAAWGWNGS